MFRYLLFLLIFLSWPVLAAPTEIYIYNTTNERFTYTQNFPNGDSKSGEIKECSAYSPESIVLRSQNSGALTCRINSESGKSSFELKGTDSQVFMLVLKNGLMSVVSGAWTANNGQAHKREIRFLNATGSSLKFDIIDEKEIRKASREKWPDDLTV